MHIQIEVTPISARQEDWQDFNERINALVGQGYTIMFSTSKYIVLKRP